MFEIAEVELDEDDADEDEAEDDDTDRDNALCFVSWVTVVAFAVVKSTGFSDVVSLIFGIFGIDRCKDPGEIGSVAG